MSKDKEQASQRAEELISALCEKELSDDLHKQTRRWFLSAPNEGTAEKALSKWAAQNVKPATSAPDRQTRDSFRRLAEALGFKNMELAPNIRRMGFVRHAMRAAAAVILVGGAYFLFEKGDKTTTPEEFLLAVDADESRTFILPDSSTVTMRNNSKLRYKSDFSSHRNVTIDGEAYFTVSPDAANPFTVTHEQLNIAVTGTEFNVDARTDVDIAEVMLNKGAITLTAGEHSIAMKPGDKVTLDKSQGYTFSLTEARSGELMRASGKEFVVESMSVNEALQVAADYYGKELVVEPGIPDSAPISIMLPDQMPPDDAISYINKLSDLITCRVEGDTIIVSKK